MWHGLARWWVLRGSRELVPDAREGDRVRVTGIVRATDELVIAPLSGRSCVAYRARVHVAGTHSSPFTLSRLPTVEETVQVRGFVIERAADAIAVVGEHARFGGPVSKGPFDGDRRLSFLARHNNPGAPGPYSEIVIEPGMRVTVAGSLVLAPAEEPPRGDRGFRDPPAPEPRIVGSRDAPLVIVRA